MDASLKTRWEQLQSLTPNLLKDILDPITDRQWVLTQCISKEFSTFEENYLLLDYGLQNSVPYALYQTIMNRGSASNNATPSSYTLPRQLQLSSDDLQWCFFHLESLYMKDILAAYKEIATTFEMHAYSAFRRTPLLETAAKYAMNEKFSSLKVLLSRFWIVLEKSWLDVLRKVPETCSVSREDYKAVLPTATASHRPPSPLRPKDWVEERSVLELLARSQAERSQWARRAGEHLSQYLDALLAEGTESAAPLGRVKRGCFSTEALLEWYTTRARELDSRSGRSDNALALVEFGRSQTSGGLEPLQNLLIDINLLVYTYGQYDLTLETYERMALNEKLAMLFANSPADDKSFIPRVTESIMPLLIRNCPTQLDAERALCEYLVSEVAPTRFSLVMTILMHSFEQASQRIIKNSNLLLSAVVSSAYAVTELTIATKALISRLPATMDRLSPEISSYSDSKSKMEQLSKHVLSWEILRSYTLEWPLKEVAALSQNKERAEYVLRFLTQQGPSKRKARESIIALARPDSVLWADLLSDLNVLMDSGVLSAISRPEVNSLFCFGALLSGRYDDVQKYLCNKQMLDREKAVEVCLKAAQTYLNAAVTLSDLEAIRHAQKCVNVLLNTNVSAFSSSPQLLAERSFITAVETIATNADWRKVIGSKSPLEIRLADKLALLLSLLQSSNTSYRDVWRLIDLAKLLHGASSTSATSSSSLIFSTATSQQPSSSVSVASTASASSIPSVASGGTLSASVSGTVIPSSSSMTSKQIATQLLIAAAEIAVRARDLTVADRIVCDLIRNNEPAAWEVAIAVAHALPADPRLRGGPYGHVMRLLSFAATHCSTEPPKLTSMSLLPAKFLCSSPLNRLLHQFTLLLAVKNTVSPLTGKQRLRDDPIDTTEETYEDDEEEEEAEEEELEEDEEEEQTSAVAAEDSDASDTSDSAATDEKAAKAEVKKAEAAAAEIVPLTLDELVSRRPLDLLPEAAKVHASTTTPLHSPLSAHPFYRLTTGESYLTGGTSKLHVPAVPASPATPLIYSVLQLKSLFDSPPPHGAAPLTRDDLSAVVHAALSLDPALAAACALTCSSPEELVAILRVECATANQSGSAKRTSQVRAWAMCVLALEAHRRLGGAVGRAEPRYSLAPDDLLASVRTLASATDTNPAVALLIGALDELSQMPAPVSPAAAAAASTPSAIPSPAGSSSATPIPALTRDLSHSSLVLEVQVDLSEWQHEAYRQQVAAGLKALPQEQVAKLLQKLAISEDLHGEEFRVVRDLFPLLSREKGALPFASLSAFYVQLAQSLLSQEGIDDAEWNRRCGALTRIVNGITFAEDTAIGNAVMDEIARACSFASGTRPSPHQRRLIVALKAEAASAVESHDSLRLLTRLYAQSDLLERWGWSSPPESLSNPATETWLTGEILPKLDSTHLAASIEDLLTLLRLGGAPSEYVALVFLDALRKHMPMARVITLLQPFRLSEKEESELLAASRANEYALDAVLALGMRSSRESLLTRTVFEIAVPNAEQIRSGHFSGFYLAVIAKSYLVALKDTALFAPTLQWVASEHRRLAQSLTLVGARSLSCTEHHLLLRALAQLCSRGLFLAASELALRAAGPAPLTSPTASAHDSWTSFDSALVHLIRCLGAAQPTGSVSSSTTSTDLSRSPLLTPCGGCALVVLAAARELDSVLL